jgi:hypothetical protein
MDKSFESEEYYNDGNGSASDYVSDIDIEENDIPSTLKGMSKSIRFKFNSRLCQYLTTFMSKVANKDLGLFENIP